MGHCIHAKISPKAVSEKAQTTVSEINRYTYPIINFLFQAIILSLLASTENNVQEHSWYTRYYVLPLLAISPSVYAVFSLHLSVSDHTCHPMIAKLLYSTIQNMALNNCLFQGLIVIHLQFHL